MSGMRRSMLIASRMYVINVLAANTSLIDAEVIEGDSYSTQIVCDEGYSVYEITIKMGGVDITSTAWDSTTNVISITSVTDDVDIVCYAMHTMPSDYIRVDGIKNPSNAYINTGYKLSKINIVKVDFTKAQGYVITSKTSGNTTTNGTVVQVRPNGNAMYDVDATGLINVPTTSDRNTYLIDHYNGHVYFNKELKRTYNKSTALESYAIWLFKCPNTADGTNSPGMIIHFFSIFDATTHVYERYYIPCLNDSGVAGFWDAARGVFQGSSNSTAFEACYTQRGLVFQLDGINKGATADAWTDLVGGNVFANNGAISQNNGWQIDNGKYLKKTPGISMDIHNNYTVEVCVTPTSAPPHMVFVLNNTSNKNQPLFMVNTGNIVTFIQMVKTCTFPSYAANNSHCISINYDRGCHNGLIVTNYGSSDYWNSSSDESFIGRRNSSTPHPFKGVIHAIRIYNRRLTLEEMKFNQRIDNKRFNLGLTI